MLSSAPSRTHKPHLFPKPRANPGLLPPFAEAVLSLPLPSCDLSANSAARQPPSERDASRKTFRDEEEQKGLFWEEEPQEERIGTCRRLVVRNSESRRRLPAVPRPLPGGALSYLPVPGLVDRLKDLMYILLPFPWTGGVAPGSVSSLCLGLGRISPSLPCAFLRLCSPLVMISPMIFPCCSGFFFWNPLLSLCSRKDR